jgi:hypothetical protein
MIPALLAWADASPRLFTAACLTAPAMAVMALYGAIVVLERAVRRAR